MNTRIQVEHPVTEPRYWSGIDQGRFAIAPGKDGRCTGAIIPSGHAIGVPYQCEDRETFVAVGGRIPTFQAPGGTGWEGGFAALCRRVIPPYYDSMIAK